MINDAVMHQKKLNRGGTGAALRRDLSPGRYDKKEWHYEKINKEHPDPAYGCGHADGHDTRRGVCCR